MLDGVMKWRISVKKKEQEMSYNNFIEKIKFWWTSPLTMKETICYNIELENMIENNATLITRGISNPMSFL